MNREWIGIATDLTEDQVVGAPYRPPALAAAAPGAGHPQAPVRGRLKTIAVIALVIAVAGWIKLAPRHGDAVKTAAPASQATPVVVRPARPLPESVVDTAEPARPPKARRQHATGKAASAPPEDTQIDLDQYRSFTKGL